MTNNLSSKLISNYGRSLAIDGGSFDYLTSYRMGNSIFIYGSYNITKFVGNYIDIFQITLSNNLPKEEVQAICVRANDATSRQVNINTNGIIRLYPCNDTAGKYKFNAIYNI